MAAAHGAEGEPEVIGLKCLELLVRLLLRSEEVNHFLKIWPYLLWLSQNPLIDFIEIKLVLEGDAAAISYLQIDLLTGHLHIIFLNLRRLILDDRLTFLGLDHYRLLFPHFWMK